MKKTLFLVIILCLIILSQAAFAAAPLEIEYPRLPGTYTPVTTETPVPWYVKYLFHFAVGIGGMIALGVLIWAGFNYLTSTGIPEKKKDAQNQITAAFLGLVILLGSWLILFTINPNITFFNLQPLRPFLPDLPSGILLCKERVSFVGTVWKAKKNEPKMSIKELIKKRPEMEVYLKQINEWCYHVPTKGDIPEQFNDNTIQAWIVPPINQEQKHGAILYKKRGFGGENQIIYGLENRPYSFDISRLQASSIKPFILKNQDEINANWNVEIFEKKQLEKEKGKNYKQYFLPNQSKPYNLDPPFSHKMGLRGKHQFQSIRIEGPLIVIFFNKLTKEEILAGGWTSITEVYALTGRGDNDMNNNLPIGTWCGIWPIRYACAKSMVLIAGGIY